MLPITETKPLHRHVCFAGISLYKAYLYISQQAKWLTWLVTLQRRSIISRVL